MRKYLNCLKNCSMPIADKGLYCTHPDFKAVLDGSTNILQTLHFMERGCLARIKFCAEKKCGVVLLGLSPRFRFG